MESRKLTNLIDKMYDYAHETSGYDHKTGEDGGHCVYLDEWCSSL